MLVRCASGRMRQDTLLSSGGLASPPFSSPPFTFSPAPPRTATLIAMKMKMQLVLWLWPTTSAACSIDWHSGAIGAESSSAPRQSCTADGDAASETDEDDVRRFRRLSDVDNESLRSDDADMLLLSEHEEQQMAVAGRRLWNASAIHPSILTL